MKIKSNHRSDDGCVHTPFDLVEASIRRVHARAQACSIDQATWFRLHVHLLKGLNDLSNEVLKPHGLNDVSMTVLMMIFGSESNALNPSLVSDYSGESRANITRVTDDLVVRGLIGRVASLDDRRKSVLSLTQTGESLIREVLPLLRARLEPVFMALDATERKQFIAMQKTLLAALDAQRIECSKG